MIIAPMLLVIYRVSALHILHISRQSHLSAIFSESQKTLWVQECHASRYFGFLISTRRFACLETQ